MIIGHSLLFLLLVTLHVTTAQSRCTTPENTFGNCINIHNCEPIIQIFRDRRPISREFLNYLQSLHCGFDGKNPKVCCELKTPPPPKTTTEGTPQDTTVVDPPDVSNHPNLQLINSDICGPASDAKILGGNKTDIFDFPWMALLAYRSPGQTTKSFKCGGTVINNRYVLTAAHCVTALPGGARLSSIRVGEHDISTERDCSKDENGIELACAEQYQDIDIESVQFHPEYSRLKLVNDIALVRLSSDANFRPKNVKPICLPLRSATTPATKKLTVTGWGRTEQGIQSDKLLQAQLTPMNTADCAQAYIGKTQIWYKQLCAGGKRGVDSCLGDSGGPLQAQSLYKNSVKYVQYGIVSFGLPNCGTENVPGVYTNVEYYMDWILDNIRS